MLVIKRIDLTEAIDRASYLPLVPSYTLADLAKPYDPEMPLMAFEAHDEGQLIGLAIASLLPGKQACEILSVFVAEPFRRRGIGTALFGYIKKSLEKEGCRIFGFDYPCDSPFTPIYDKILHHLHWSVPTLYFVGCHYRVAEFNPPWFQKSYPPFPKSIKIFPWSELKDHERELIERQIRQETFPALFSPFREESKIELLNSLGIRKGDQVIGWMITHRIDAETIRYTTLYIAEEYRLTHYAIALLIRAIKLQQSSSVPLSLFEVNIRLTEPAWWRFVKRRLMPYADRIEKRKLSRVVSTDNEE